MRSDKSERGGAAVRAPRRAALRRGDCRPGRRKQVVSGVRPSVGGHGRILMESRRAGAVAPGRSRPSRRPGFGRTRKRDESARNRREPAFGGLPPPLGRFPPRTIGGRGADKTRVRGSEVRGAGRVGSASDAIFQAP